FQTNFEGSQLSGRFLDRISKETERQVPDSHIEGKESLLDFHFEGINWSLWNVISWDLWNGIGWDLWNGIGWDFWAEW
ncbi:hypothetical protein RhiirA4_489268, partial [Rhizophagus irregularis]